MIKLIYRFAFILAAVTFVSNLLNSSISGLYEPLLRSLIVFISVLAIFFVGGQIMRIGVHVMEVKPSQKAHGEAQEPVKK